MNTDAPIQSPEGAGTSPTSPRGNLTSLLIEAGSIAESALARATRIHERLESKQPFIRTLQDLGLIDEATIRAVVRRHRTSIRLGDLLVELGHLQPDDLARALAIQAHDAQHRKLGEILVGSQLISEGRLTELLSDLLGFEYVDPNAAEIPERLVTKIAPRWCMEHSFVPVREEGGKAIVAFADPLESRNKLAAQQMLSCEVEPVIARRTRIHEVLQALERGSRAGSVSVDDRTTITLVDSLIREAAAMGASDIHIEPLRGHTRVRYRIDGMMIPQREISLDLTASVVSRVKVMAKADIAERRRHQDGRILFEDEESGNSIDLRMSTYVTIHGEKVVLRLLDRRSELLSIKELGMAPRMLARFCEDALDAPTGVVLITGPTGSGKTTTLYGCVDYLNAPDVSIITAEDPVEYVLDDIAQCSINPKINLTFEETLRHIVRQDPDIIVLGEVRDRFSADVAIQAALTGHKVLTTFHTEDSIGGLLRLLNMNIEAFLISSTVVSVLAQRLLRRVCTECAEPQAPTAQEQRRLGLDAKELAAAGFRHGRGCQHCRFTGYRGRICVFELLVLNEAVKEAIVARKTSYEIRRLSIETSGLVTLIEDGIYKASLGLTTLAEVLRGLPRVMPARSLREIRRILGT